jgi:hypothetical protein
VLLLALLPEGEGEARSPLGYLLLRELICKIKIGISITMKCVDAKEKAKRECRETCVTET